MKRYDRRRRLLVISWSWSYFQISIINTIGCDVLRVVVDRCQIADTSIDRPSQIVTDCDRMMNSSAAVAAPAGIRISHSVIFVET